MFCINSRRTNASTILCLVYGWAPTDVAARRATVDYVNDFIVRLATLAVPGSNLVDVFPALLNIPRWLAPWRTHAEESVARDSKFFEGLLGEVRAGMVGLSIFLST